MSSDEHRRCEWRNKPCGGKSCDRRVEGSYPTRDLSGQPISPRCIFHAELEHKGNSIIFWKELKSYVTSLAATSDRELDLQGFVFPAEIPGDDELSLRGILSQDHGSDCKVNFNEVSFSKAVFWAEANFSFPKSSDNEIKRLVFDGKVSFEGTVFKDKAEFDNVVFRQGVDFKEVAFGRGVVINGAEIWATTEPESKQDDHYFDVDMRGAQFPRGITFRGCALYGLVKWRWPGTGRRREAQGSPLESGTLIFEQLKAKSGILDISGNDLSDPDVHLRFQSCDMSRVLILDTDAFEIEFFNCKWPKRYDRILWIPRHLLMSFWRRVTGDENVWEECHRRIRRVAPSIDLTKLTHDASTDALKKRLDVWKARRKQREDKIAERYKDLVNFAVPAEDMKWGREPSDNPNNHEFNMVHEIANLLGTEVQYRFEPKYQHRGWFWQRWDDLRYIGKKQWCWGLRKLEETSSFMIQFKWLTTAPQRDRLRALHTPESMRETYQQLARRYQELYNGPQAMEFQRSALEMRRREALDPDSHNRSLAAGFWLSLYRSSSHYSGSVILLFLWFISLHICFSLLYAKLWPQYEVLKPWQLAYVLDKPTQKESFKQLEHMTFEPLFMTFEVYPIARLSDKYYSSRKETEEAILASDTTGLSDRIAVAKSLQLIFDTILLGLFLLTIKRKIGH